MTRKTITVSSSSVQGSITIPPSKSQTLRAILFGAMGSGKSKINNLLISPDTFAMMEACRCLGAEITYQDNTAIIRGIGSSIRTANDIIDAGNSGLVLRFITAIGAMGAYPIIVTGDYSIRHNRPMNDLLDGLQQFGVRTETLRDNGYAPIIVKGPLRPGTAQVIGCDSQPVSALLIAAGLSQGTYEILVKDPGEKPWVDLTLQWLDRLGICYTNDTYCRYTVTGKREIDPIHYSVPGDLSSCAFPVAAAIVTGSTLTIDHVDLTDEQGDKKLFNILQQMGANIEVIANKQQLIVRGGQSLKGIEVDINDCIDAIVILSVIACYAEGTTVITNAAVAREKECDRIAAIKEELTKMGALIEERPDGLIIHGSSLQGVEVWSHCDHRMALALAVAGMGAIGTTTIQDTTCIAKTYPSFVADFASIGATIEEVL